MIIPDLSALSRSLSDLRAVHPLGRITALSPSGVEIAGLSRRAELGARVEFIGQSQSLTGEVVQIDTGRALALCEGVPAGLEIGAAVKLLGPAQICPDQTWLGRLIDPLGQALDGCPIYPGPRAYALRAAPPAAILRKPLGERLRSGQRAFDTFLPIVQGQRLGLFAGSGVGKTTLLGRLARAVTADVVVIALIGERGRELRSFVEAILGPEGMARSVVVAATSDRSPLLRRQCASAAMCVAEYFRDQGKQVLFLADSITRFAEAHREIALAAGEPASLMGYPASLPHEIMHLAERAGPGPEGAGDITALFTVLVAGSDMEGLVADVLRGTLDGHVVLDRKIAERGRYPAIDVLRSVSRALPEAASEAENALLVAARRLLSAYDRAALMIQAGLYVAGSDATIDAALKVWPELDSFLAEEEPLGISESYHRLGQIMAKAGKG